MKKKLELDINTAKKLYKEASAEFKTLLEENFGKSELIGKPTTFEEACEMVGIIVKTNFGDRDKQEIAEYKLRIIIKALNGDGKLNWNSTNQYKYYPYWDMRDDKLHFHYSIYYCSCSSVSSHLCFLKKEDCEYAAKQFIDLYKDFMLL